MEIADERILTPYLITGGEAKGTVLICPGGGYGFVSPREGKPVAKAFNALGFNAFVLEYTVANEENGIKPPLGVKPLSEAAWAVSYLRENAESYHIHPEKIAVCGFSAGGHLAASLGVYWNKPEFFGGNKPAQCYRPNALILCYPVITAGEYSHAGSIENLAGNEDARAFSLENHVGKHTPPSFIWHTAEDALVPVQNSLMFANKLAEYKIPFELHVYPFGWHGLSIATADVNKGFENKHISEWVADSAKWLELTM